MYLNLSRTAHVEWRSPGLRKAQKGLPGKRDVTPKRPSSVAFAFNVLPFTEFREPGMCISQAIRGLWKVAAYVEIRCSRKTSAGETEKREICKRARRNRVASWDCKCSEEWMPSGEPSRSTPRSARRTFVNYPVFPLLLAGLPLLPRRPFFLGKRNF